MAKESRTKNTKRNIIISYIYTVITILFEFVSRMVIVHYLGSNYLGLTSLFTSLLQVLNMAEMGFSGAIVYNMYKPLAEDDTETVCALLAYYKKIYRIVGTVVFSVGIAIAPFIPRLIKSDLPADINIYILYFLYLANTGLSYFLFAYKSALLEAMQRIDLVKFAYTLVVIAQYFLQIISLIVFKNFYGFVLALIIGTVSKNIVVAIVSKKKYPMFECRGALTSSTKNDVISRVKGLLVCKISSVTYTTFDSIILSSFIGLGAVAIYNNYITVYTGVTTFVALIRNAMQASVGNSVVKESVDKNYNDMLLWQFLFTVIATFCTACMLCLYQPFMKIWMGNDLLLPMPDVLLICMWFAVTVVQHAYFLYLSGNGLWWEMRWPYIMSTVCNLVMNVVLGKFWGTTGIIFASMFSSLVFCFIWQCLIIFKCYFKRSAWEFFRKQIWYFAVLIIACAAAYFACDIIALAGILGLILKGIVCCLVTGLVVIVFYFKTKIFADAVSFLKKAVRA